MSELMNRFLSIRVGYKLAIIFLLISCAPQATPAPVIVPTSIPTPSGPAHAPEIRFALIGTPKDVNIWQLFDESGASYLDYALRFEYLPRLYFLAPPDNTFTSLAADGAPSEITKDGNFYTATVNIRADLKWTDGSAFTAEDAAFTANTALAFELGYDWSTYYPREYLDHAEALNPLTVKYFFTKKPNAGIWQYGVLQGPIIQKTFWESAVTNASNLLPDETLRADINESNLYLATVNTDVARLQAQVLTVAQSGGQDRKLDGDLKNSQGELIHAQNNLNKLLEEYTSQIDSAQTALYGASDEGEPMLGTWKPLSRSASAWINEANPDYPFVKPNFDRAVYRFFENDAAAFSAFQNNEVDFILSQNTPVYEDENIKTYPSYNARFLIFNPSNTLLADSAIHLALSCMIDRTLLAGDVLQNRAMPLDSFVASAQWHDSSLQDACAGLDETARINYAVKLLKDAGYSWTQTPDTDKAGQNLILPNGGMFPSITLSVPFKEEDVLRYAAAEYIAQQAQYLGFSFAVQEMSFSDVIYEVYSSQKYDMALIGLRLSEYPAYLCEMFGGQNRFLYNSISLMSGCDALGGESNVDAARQSSHQIESRLMLELPLIPLFTVTSADMYHHLLYPVPDVNILNGWGSFYGAPSYALPAP